MKDYEHHIRRMVRVHRDVLDEKHLQPLTEAANTLRQKRQQSDIEKEAVDRTIQDADETLRKLVPRHIRQRHWIGEYLEVMTV
ncbi:MAG: hypothetical protein K9N51_08005, partial [Candidatus Pacebacteria bacterium]|nr:hypothetical protein [Candidatus Paceibacterota bacterium]